MRISLGLVLDETAHETVGLLLFLGSEIVLEELHDMALLLPEVDSLLEFVVTLSEQNVAHTHIFHVTVALEHFSNLCSDDSDRDIHLVHLHE